MIGRYHHQPSDFPVGSIGWELAVLEAHVRRLPWWQFFWKRRLLDRIDRTRNTIAFARDDFIRRYCHDEMRDVAKVMGFEW